MTGNHEMYKVFTPFKNARLKRLREGDAGVRLSTESAPRRGYSTGAPVTLNYPRQSFDTAHFPVEEKAAIAQLRHFATAAQGRTSNSEIFLLWKAPAVCPPPRQLGDYPPPVFASPVDGTAAGAGWRTG